MLDRMLLASASTEALYVEDVFSTYLWTGNGSSQTINNGIDLTGKGGMVWARRRDGVNNHRLADTARGAGPTLSSNTTGGDTYGTNSLTSFTSSGFTTGTGLSTSGATYTSWTFRKAPKFFDVVTWTGNGSAIGQFINHSLGVAPGFIVGKRISGSSNWITWHRANGGSPTGRLNNTGALDTTGWISDTAFVGTASTRILVAGTDTADLDHMNVLGETYVAYLFAHDATADGIIQCGSFTADSGGLASVNLGWEPQWVMVKSSDAAGSWQMIDTMRGWRNDSASANDARLWANLTNVEQTTSQLGNPTATGFDIAGQGASQTYIYIAIRRGPMKTPTVGTSVFAPITSTSAGGTRLTSGFPVDGQFYRIDRTASINNGGSFVVDRLRGVSCDQNVFGNYLATALTDAENTFPAASLSFDNTGFYTASLAEGTATVYWNFRRAPGFFDVVCYTGTGGARTVNHNLGVAPELMILKSRSGAGTLWYTYWSQLGIDKMVRLNTTDQAYSGFSGILNNTVPSATTFSLATANSDTNNSGTRYVAYLFASCPGVSKVGSYTGNGSSQTINCGFSSGARFFLVKRTNASGDWWVYDSARGIVAAADPALNLNTQNAEVTSADAVDPASSGIIVNQEATCNINVNGATYIYLAIA